jgi:hypothetical protein
MVIPSEMDHGQWPLLGAFLIPPPPWIRTRFCNFSTHIQCRVKNRAYHSMIPLNNVFDAKRHHA